MQSSSQHGRCLGVGAKGSVFLGFNRDNGHLVAVKELTLPGDDAGRGEEVAAIANEVSLMKSFQHPNLVAYLGVRSAGASRIHILMEYVPGGSIGKLVARFGALPERVCKRYIRDVLAALVYLHDEKLVCHRDVKPDNILLTAEGRCKLCDFGTGKSVENGVAEHDSTSLNTCVGTPSYMAPEVLEGQGYGTKADLWSLGVTLFELLSGAAPFADCANPYAVMYRITTGELPVLAPELGVSADGSQFLQMCMEPDAALRPTAAALLDHPWISGVDMGVDDITNAVIMATTPRKGSSPGSSPSRTPPRATSHRVSVVEEDEAVSDSDQSPLYPCHRCGVSATFECDDCRRVFGRLYRTCPSCWEPIHAALPRGKHHVKRPLLLDSTAPHHDGVLLESGAYVDLCGSGGAGWTCGRCNTFNGSMSPSCEMCNHLR